MIGVIISDDSCVCVYTKHPIIGLTNDTINLVHLLELKTTSVENECLRKIGVFCIEPRLMRFHFEMICTRRRNEHEPTFDTHSLTFHVYFDSRMVHLDFIIL